MLIGLVRYLIKQENQSDIPISDNMQSLTYSCFFLKLANFSDLGLYSCVIRSPQSMCITFWQMTQSMILSGMI